MTSILLCSPSVMALDLVKRDIRAILSLPKADHLASIYDAVKGILSIVPASLANQEGVTCWN